MADLDFSEVVADLEPPDWDATKAAANAATVATFYGTLRAMNVPSKAAQELTVQWMCLLAEDD